MGQLSAMICFTVHETKTFAVAGVGDNHVPVQISVAEQFGSGASPDNAGEPFKLDPIALLVDGAEDVGHLLFSVFRGGRPIRLPH